MNIAAITALRHRARTSRAAALLIPGWRREEQQQFWQGYATALRDLTRGAGDRLAAKDAGLGGYAPPRVLRGAIEFLADDVEHLTRGEVLQRLAEAGIQLPDDAMAAGDVVAAQQLEDAAGRTVHLHGEHAAGGVAVADGSGQGHRSSVCGAQKGGAQ